MLKNRRYIFLTISLLCVFSCFSQEDLNVKIQDSLIVNTNDFDPLSPATAAFYSAILPGLGQAYNKKYWKIPIVYGALGTGVYFYVFNSKNYNRARDAYKLRLGGKEDEFNGEDGNPFLSTDSLVSIQKSYKRDKDLSVLVLIGLYVLQIIEANTNAHLLQHNVDNNLSINPKIFKNPGSNRSIVGASIHYNF